MTSPERVRHWRGQHSSFAGACGLPGQRDHIGKVDPPLFVARGETPRRSRSSGSGQCLETVYDQLKGVRVGRVRLHARPHCTTRLTGRSKPACGRPTFDPNSAVVHSTLSWNRFMRQEFDAALASAERAVALNPNDPEVRCNDGMDSPRFVSASWCHS